MINFELVTPERTLFREIIEEVTLPTAEGEITVLTHHAPLVAVLVPGVARLKLKSGHEEVAVSGGFIQVGNNVVRVLADTAERATELDLSAIEAAKARAEQVMKEADRQDEKAYAMAAAGLERELARYRVAMKHRHAHGTKTPNL